MLFSKLSVFTIGIGASLSLIHPMPVMAAKGEKPRQKDSTHILTNIEGSVITQRLDEEKGHPSYEGELLQGTDKLILSKNSSAQVVCKNAVVLNLNRAGTVPIGARCNDQAKVSVGKPKPPKKPTLPTAISPSPSPSRTTSSSSSYQTERRWRGRARPYPKESPRSVPMN
jgi:hypothetical protein